MGNRWWKSAVLVGSSALTLIIVASAFAFPHQPSPVALEKSVPLFRGGAEDYIGAQQCGGCHAAKLAAQRSSEHARALSRPATHALASHFAPRESLVRGTFSYRFLQNPDGLSVRAWSDSQEITIPVEWAFGAGSQAVTFVSRVNPEWYIEHALSYYSVSGSYSNTPGQSLLPEKTLAASLGTLFRSDDAKAGVFRCFQCHSTGSVARDDKGELHPQELGVRCEVCHGPGRAHREAALSRNAVRATQTIENPKRFSADQMNHFCGNCHRPPADSGAEIDWRVAWNVRHQPVYLSESECFRKGQGDLSCLTCHDPHTALRTDQSYYNAKCTSCHNLDRRPPAPSCLTAQRSNCVDCHMPRVSPQSYLRFTNHWIGIYGPDKLRPLR
jgi:hypothetical protein